MSVNATLEKPAATSKSERKVVPQEEWITARKALLTKEKEATHLLSELSRERRQLPWVKITKDYVFDSPEGRVKLGDLFEGRQQLVVYHFMFGPEWQEGCPSCSFVSDHFDGALPHLAARDVTLVAASHAPLAKLEAFKKRMDWKFKWVSAHDTDFNGDFHVSFSPEELATGKVNYNYALQEFPSSEGPGLSVFYKDASGDIFHTYSTYGRGLENIMGTYKILDLVPKGRDEDDLPFTMEWVRYHDRYEAKAAEFADADKPYWPEVEGAASSGSCCCAKAEAKS